MKYNTIFIGGPRNGHKMNAHPNYGPVMTVAEMKSPSLYTDDYHFPTITTTRYYQHKFGNTYIYVVEGMTLEEAISRMIGKYRKPAKNHMAYRSRFI